jgi:hypothetical protein
LRLALVATLLFAVAVPQAAQVDPAKLPARDFHQGILVACDPYQNPERAKKAIGKDDPLKAGILPLEVYVRNTTKWPVVIALDKVRLDVALPGSGHDEIKPLNSEEVADLILHPRPRTAEVPRARLPFPIPRASRGKKWQELHEKLQTLSFPDAVIAPGATVHGFFFFNIAGRYDVLRYAQFYVPDLKFLGNGQSIMFFQANLGAAAAP